MSITNETTSTRVRKDSKTLQQELAQFTGDLDRYRHWTRRLIYTPGIRHLAQNAGAYWLIDLVASWQMRREVAVQTFQIWKLIVRSDRTATATVSSDDETILASQVIEHTDFPLDEITVWLIDGTLLLPSEY